MRKLLSILMLCGLSLAVMPGELSAQCPMCKMSMESNLNNGGSAGKGLNKGILMLFAMPYLIIGGLGYVWYRNRKPVNDEFSASEMN